MTRTDLISHIATTADMSKATAAKAIDAVFIEITAALGRGEEVMIKGFGAFSTAERPAREGRNPRTGEPIQVPATRSPKFKAGKSLKDAVNG